MNVFADAVIRLRWLVILIFLAISAFFAVQLPSVEIDPEVKNQLPSDMPARLSLERVEEIFGGSEMVMVVVEADDVLEPATLSRIQGISEDLAELEQTERVMDLFNLPDIRGEAGMMVVAPTIDVLPTTGEERAALREAIRGNRLVYGNVVSRDFKAAAVIATLGMTAQDSETVADVEAVLAANPGPESITVGGFPKVRTQVSEDIRKDLRSFVPIGLLLILVFLYACFRQLRGVILPLTLVVMSTLVAMGLIPLLGWKIQMVTVILPVILLAVANDYGIHLMARYQEDNVPGGIQERKALARSGVTALGLPVIAAGLTTMAGLLCLTSHIIVPARQLGILAAIGVGFAIVGSLCFIPAVLATLPVPRPVAMLTGGSPRGLELLLSKMADLVVQRPRGLLVAVSIFTLLSASGISRVQVDTNPINYYGPEAPVSQNASLINKHFGGSTEISFMVEGDAQDPELLVQIDALEERLRGLDQVDYTLSVSQVVRTMFQAVNDGDPAFDRVPDERATIAQLFLLHSMGGDPEDFARMVDFSYEHTLVTARINRLSTSEISEVVNLLSDEIEQGKWSPGTMVAGFGVMFTDLVDAVVKGQALSLALSLGLVFVLVAFCFRSLVAGLYAVLPLLMAIPILFGLMGYLNIELNVVTAMLSSIMIGVGVDYTIHFLWRYREERRAGVEAARAVHHTLTTVGRGIVFNALSVVTGFAVLLVSSFLPVRFFGFLVVICISACLVGALVLLPALCLVIRPRFLSGGDARGAA